MKPGLVSITFRKLTPSQILDLCVGNGLREIEWGGDVHVPHGELKIASEVAEMSRSRGVAIAAYGSYYKLGAPGGAGVFLRPQYCRRFGSADHSGVGWEQRLCRGRFWRASRRR